LWKIYTGNDILEKDVRERVKRLAAFAGCRNANIAVPGSLLAEI
jgi:hypothetical protein